LVLYNFRVGDLVVVQDSTGVLLKQTSKYWYYFYKNQEARISKEKLWGYVDIGKVRIVMPSLKYRRRQKKMRTLNLHGITHKEVEEVVRSFLNFVELPCQIITGKSEKMKTIVGDIVTEYGWSYNDKNSYNTGTLVVHE